jgi:hypothetical protein
MRAHDLVRENCRVESTKNRNRKIELTASLLDDLSKAPFAKKLQHMYCRSKSAGLEGLVRGITLPRHFI